MNPRDIEQIIEKGEGLTTEFKKAKNQLPSDLFETVCAFLNRKGGHLILGVKDDGTILGVDPEHMDRMKKDFTSLSNNQNKLNPPFLLEFSEVNLRGKVLLHVYIPESSQTHRYENIVYDRSYEGDFKVRDDGSISNIYIRKSSFYSESEIFPYLGISDFKPGILNRVRQLIRSRASGHPWLSLSDIELISSAGLYRKDFKTGQEGCTLAAALLLGSDEVIQNILPHYRIDAIVRKENVDRYDDRLDIRTNLIEAYEMLRLFVSKHLPDKFHLQGEQRISLRDSIFREVIANLIVHREYSNAAPARLVIYNDRVETDNANKPSTFGPINPEKFSPFPKNPNIARFFVQLGLVEELGSGIRNVTRLLEYYSPGKTAQFIEEDVFRAIVPITGAVPVIEYPASVERRTESSMNDLLEGLGKVIDKIPVHESIQKRLHEEVWFFAQGHVFSAAGLSDILKVHPRTVRRDFGILMKAEVIQPSEAFSFYELSDKWKEFWPKG